MSNHPPSFSEFVRSIAPHDRDALSLLKTHGAWKLLVCSHDGRVRQWAAPTLPALIRAACGGDATAQHLPGPPTLAEETLSP